MKEGRHQAVQGRVRVVDGALGYGREAPRLMVLLHSSMGEKFISQKGIRMLLECQTSEGSARGG